MQCLFDIDDRHDRQQFIFNCGGQPEWFEHRREDSFRRQWLFASECDRLIQCDSFLIECGRVDIDLNATQFSDVSNGLIQWRFVELNGDGLLERFADCVFGFLCRFQWGGKIEIDGVVGVRYCGRLVCRSFRSRRLRVVCINCAVLNDGDGGHQRYGTDATAENSYAKGHGRCSRYQTVCAN